MTTSSLPEEQLRQQIRVRLVQGRLSPASDGYKTHQGTGRPCLVCRRDIGRAEVECAVDGAGVVMVAHETCYLLWREESVIQADLRTMPTCHSCGKPILASERRYRTPAGEAHVECHGKDERRGAGS